MRYHSPLPSLHHFPSLHWRARGSESDFQRLFACRDARLSIRWVTASTLPRLRVSHAPALGGVDAQIQVSLGGESGRVSPTRISFSLSLSHSLTHSLPDHFHCRFSTHIEYSAPALRGVGSKYSCIA
jgi:hypothetical protein